MGAASAAIGLSESSSIAAKAAPTAVKRLCCDGSVVPLIHHETGTALDAGRKQRTVSAALKRALISRDRGCTFPGCHHTRYLDAHHIVHWANGGETLLANLLTLCTTHHRLVHEGGFSIQRNRLGDYYFTRPDGRPITIRSAETVDDRVEEARVVYRIGGERTFRGMACSTACIDIQS